MLKSKITIPLPVVIETSSSIDVNNVRAVITVPTTKAWGFDEIAGVFSAKGLNLSALYKADKKDIYHAFLSKADQAVTMEEASVKGFNSVGSNIFADEEDNIWEAVDTASGKMLIKKTDISAQQIVSSLKARGEVASINRRIPVEESTKIGDFVIIFDSSEGYERSGFVTSENTLFDYKKSEFASFDNKEVVCVVEGVYELASTSSKAQAKKIYTYNKSLFEDVEKIALSIVKFN